MSSSQKSPKPQTPPLSRWKGRLRLFNKLTLWVSTSVLLLIGLLIAEYSQDQMNQADIEKQLELASEESEDKAGKGDRQDATDLSKYSDASQPETLDGIPLPDDPELREWAIREANNLNTDLEVSSQSDLMDGNQAPMHSNEDALKDSLTDAPTHLLTNSEDAEAPINNNAATSSTRQNRQQNRRQQNQVESIFSGDINEDDVLTLMGLKPPRTSASRLSTPSLEGTPSSGGNTLDFFSGSTSEPLPPSVLSQALQNLTLESGTPIDTPSFANGTEASGRLSQSVNLEPSLFTLQGSGQALEGVPIFQQPSIQTAPFPGTTGYIAPPPLPSTTLPGNDGIPPATVDIIPNAPLGSIVPSAVLAPQPTVSVPHSQSTAPPASTFGAPAPVEHIPYTGGGRNGNINTFSNP